VPVETVSMHSELRGPVIIHLDEAAGSEVPPADCCDLCRTEAPLYRLLLSVDALCERCFAMWHG
jgi:hypothetical protein